MTSYYFSPTGNDSTGAGTQVSPWQTLSKAYTMSTAGDTLLADAGNGNHTWSNQVFSGSRTVGIYNGTTAVFDGGNAGVEWDIQGVSLTISNIKFQNASNYNGGNLAFFCCKTANGSVLSITNCIFYNLIPTNNFWGVVGIFNFTATISIVGCLFWNCSANGNAGTSYFSNFGASASYTITNTTLYSNLTASNTLNFWISNSGNSDSFAITNLIVANLNGSNKPWVGGGSGNTYTGSNNDFFGYSSTPSLTGNISSDPLFVDAAGGNFNLRPTSPCIDAGTAI